jgi:aspartyl-tRNA(Asn)/glutamyl-tRNA(Gln) amidotransferase subunit C
MRITKESLRNVSNTVKLSLTAEEELRLIKDLNQLIDFIETMNELDTDNEEPMTYIHSNKNVYRDDVVTNSNAGQELHSNAPESTDGYYVVPRIM